MYYTYCGVFFLPMLHPAVRPARTGRDSFPPEIPISVYNTYSRQGHQTVYRRSKFFAAIYGISDRGCRGCRDY